MLKRLIRMLANLRLLAARQSFADAVYELQDARLAITNARQYWSRKYRRTGGVVPDRIATNLNSQYRRAERRLARRARHYQSLAARSREPRIPSSNVRR